jgi:hypothetical protein
MAKKRIDVSNRLSYTIIAVVALILVSAGVYSYGTTNPSSFGHSIGEIGCSDAFCAKDGKIGIGTTIPAGLLHLYKTNGAADFVMAGSTGNWWWLSTSADSTKFLIGATGETRPADNNYPITISNGNIGIGTNNPQAKLHVNGNLRFDNSLYSNPSGVTSTDLYLSVNLDGTNYIIPLYSPPKNLVNNIHLSTDCVNAGGEVVVVIEGFICRFNNPTCPSGWAKHREWSTTSVKECFGTCQACRTGSHYWADISQETCMYATETQVGCVPNQCKAIISQIGCY